MSNGKAPVCPISRDQAVSGMPLRTMPPIPHANDLISAIAALNQMIAFLNPGVNSGQSTGYSQSDSTSVPTGGSTPESDDGSGPKHKKGWEERNRGLSFVLYYNPDDRDITVSVPRITRLKFEERRTFTQLDWNLGNDSMS